MTIGSRILEWRKARSMTQAALAEKASMSPSSVAMYETNRRVPDVTSLNKLADALGIPVALLAGGMPDHTASPTVQDEDEDEDGDGQAKEETPNTTPSMESPAEPTIADGATVAANPPKPPGTTQLELTPEEAKIILFLRLNPASMTFFESYIRSDTRQRDQLTRTWRLIHDFQRPTP